MRGGTEIGRGNEIETKIEIETEREIDRGIDREMERETERETVTVILHLWTPWLGEAASVAVAGAIPRRDLVGMDSGTVAAKGGGGARRRHPAGAATSPRGTGRLHGQLGRGSSASPRWTG